MEYRREGRNPLKEAQPGNRENSTVALSQNNTKQSISSLWLKYRDQILGKIDAIDIASRGLASGVCTDEMRQGARIAAHSIAGSAGTFGFPEGTRIARELEQIFEKDTIEGLHDKTSSLRQLTEALRSELNGSRSDNPKSSTQASKPSSVENLAGEKDKTIISRSDTYSILHVEDDPVFQSMIKDQLAEGLAFEFTSEIATSGKEALEKVENRTFDLILVDYLLPDTDGLSLLGELRRRNGKSSFIFISGQEDQRITVRAMKEGANDYVVKSEILSDSKPLLKAITNIILDSSVPPGIDREDIPEILESLSKPGGFSLEIITRMDSQAPISKIPKFLKILSSLREAGIVETIANRTVVKCPKCGSIENYPSLVCPECESEVMEKEDTMLHLKCEKIDFTRAFTKNDETYVCPNCLKPLSDKRVDSRKLGNWFKCNNNHVFERPTLSYKCKKCTALFTFESSKVETIYKYQLSPNGRKRMRLRLAVGSDNESEPVL
jgi:CheY-like chemotaxis protein/DNA-directed RNA polymerase subunit RPC12/RpoP